MVISVPSYSKVADSQYIEVARQQIFPNRWQNFLNSPWNWSNSARNLQSGRCSLLTPSLHLHHGTINVCKQTHPCTCLYCVTTFHSFRVWGIGTRHKRTPCKTLIGSQSFSAKLAQVARKMYKTTTWAQLTCLDHQNKIEKRAKAKLGTVRGVWHSLTGTWCQ